MRAAAMMAVVIGCFALILAGSFTPAEAGACVSFVGPGSATLTDNVIAEVSPCDPGDTPLIEVTGPFTLDMAGFKVDCQRIEIPFTTTTGIRLLGSGAVLKNGLVQGCDIGVDVAGTGNHKIQRMVAKNKEDGFNVASNRNELTNSSAVNNITGFLISGNQNKLDEDTAATPGIDNFGGPNFMILGNENTVKNSAASGGCHGFQVFGNKNKLAQNTASGSTSHFPFPGLPGIPCDGFNISVGSSLNELNGNVSSAHDGNGFNNEGNTNKFTNNVATGNKQRGFRNHESNSNQILNNTAVGNNDDGIRLGQDSNHNLVKGNRTFGNEGDGIDVSNGAPSDPPATFNTITGNSSYGNVGNDLADDNAACDSNTWTGNIFGTMSQACID